MSAARAVGALLGAVGVAGCTAGPVDVTRIEDVRVVAAIAEPPEVAVGEAVTLTVVVANPTAEPAHVAVFQCGPPELPCGLVEATLDGDELVVPWIGGSPLPVWIVACLGEVCVGPTEAEQRDPYGWLQELPLVGVSAATKTIGVTDLPVEERRQNPVLTEPPDVALDGIAPEAETTLSLVAPGSYTVAGLTTAGGFGQAVYEVASDGSVAPVWYAPDTAGDVSLYLVVDDAYGGTAVWRGSATVR